MSQPAVLKQTCSLAPSKLLNIHMPADRQLPPKLIDKRCRER